MLLVFAAFSPRGDDRRRHSARTERAQKRGCAKIAVTPRHNVIHGSGYAITVMRSHHAPRLGIRATRMHGAPWPTVAHHKDLKQ